MSYRRRHRWFRRMALGLAFASVLFAGSVSDAVAKPDGGTDGSRYVTAGGWSGEVDMESGIPLSAGIPHGDEEYIVTAESLRDPIGPGEQASVAAAVSMHDRYPSLGPRRPDGDEIAIRNVMEAQTLASAEAIRDPFTSPGVLGEAVKTNLADAKFIPGVTDFPTAASLAPDNRVERALEQGPPVISYLSHGMTADDVVGARPDDRADRFAHSDVQTPLEVSSSGSTFEWNDALTVGIGALVLALGLGLALGVLRRPRLAGL